MSNWKTIHRIVAICIMSLVLVSCGGGSDSPADNSQTNNSSVTFVVSTTVAPAAGGVTSGTGNFTRGQNVTLTATANIGYVFINWAEDGTEVLTSANYSFTASADRALVANFQLDSSSYSIIGNASMGGAVSGSGSYNGDSTVTLVATPSVGYSFVNWIEEGVEVSTSASYSFTASADRTLVANFQQNVFSSVLSLTFVQSKIFRFTWTNVASATYYKLLENPDGISGFSQVGTDLTQNTQTLEHVVPLYDRINAKYILQSCNVEGCTDSNTISVSSTLVNAIGYFKASNTDAYDRFGDALSLSDDGNTLAVGAWAEDSTARGLDGDQSNNLGELTGAVYVFTRNGGAWSQQAYLKASNADGGDRFGEALSLSADGDILAVGARGESSNSRSNQADNSASYNGAVYLFTRSSGTWSQRDYLKASNTGSYVYFGAALSLSNDGNTLAAHGGEAVYVFTRSGDTWIQQSDLIASNAAAGDYFGWTLSLNGDGNTLAVGAREEDSNATGIDGDQTNNLATRSGAVYIFTRSANTWSQQAYLKASNAGAGDYFGWSLSLSDDGNTLAVGAREEDSNASGVGGDQSNNLAGYSGAVYLFTRSGSSWSQQAYLKASNVDAFDAFGTSLCLSGNGNILVVGAVGESSSATGINGNLNNSMGASGAAYLFIRSGDTWSQKAYLKASNTDSGDAFGGAISLSGDGNSLAIAGSAESSSARGVGGDQANSALGLLSGAVYLY